MPPKSTSSRLEDAIQEAARRFALDLMGVIRSATVEELASLKGVGGEAPAPPPKKRGRPAKAAAEAPPKRRGRPPKKPVEEVVDETPVEVKKPRKKRAWPTCTAPDCAKNVYMPSGPLKMCYQHYLEQGGKPSPLVAFAKKKKAAATKAAPAKTKAAKKAAPKKAAPKKTAPKKTAKKK